MSETGTGSCPAVSAAYADQGVAVHRSLVASETVALLSTYLALRSRVGTLDRDQGHVEGSDVVYGDPIFDALLARLRSIVSAATGLELVPTYSFVRLYYMGQTLRAHRDRPACEHSVTVHLSASDPTPWPVAFRQPDGEVETIHLDPGDGAIYRGCDLEHWRDPCPVAWYAQAFFHFVEADGPHANELFDRRPYLGLPATTKAVRAASVS